MLTQCVHCNGVMSNGDYWYFTERLPIHTACIGYVDAKLLAKLFPNHPSPLLTTVDSM